MPTLLNFEFVCHVLTDGNEYIIPGEGISDGDPNIVAQSFVKMKKVIKLLSTNRTSDEVPIIFILDCCRLELGLAGSRSVVGSRGSAEIKVLSNLGSAANICVMYSTARGYLASDGGKGSENGAYTEYLLKHLHKVGTISELSTNVR